METESTEPDLSKPIQYYLDKGYTTEDAHCAAYAQYLIDLDIFKEIDRYLTDNKFNMSNTIPKTLSDAVICLDSLITKEDKVLLKAAKDKNNIATELHSTLGRHLRNEWGLWAGSDLALHLTTVHGITHPDDMSHKIIITYLDSLVK